MTVIPYKPVQGRLVEVYRNLHNGKLSVRDYKTKRVVGHADEVFLEEVQFVVSEAGRKRVRREKRKNVHAFVRGFECVVNRRRRWQNTVTYNPYQNETFIDDDGIYAYEASFALVRVTGVRVRW